MRSFASISPTDGLLVRPAPRLPDVPLEMIDERLGGGVGLGLCRLARIEAVEKRGRRRGVVQIRVLDVHEADGRFFNISSGVAVRHGDILAHVRDIAGHEYNVNPGSCGFIDRGGPLDITAARNVLGFAPRFGDIREGLAD